MRKFVIALAVVAAGLQLAACSDPVDQAAKQNIFSPENPPKVIAAAAQNVALDRLAEDPALARRVLRMGAAEVTERIGPHRYQAEVAFEWKMDGGRVALSESRTLLAGRGGVSGDFHGTTENSRDQGMEVIRVGGQVFARSRYGKFRQRLRDRGMAERSREDLQGALRDFDELFQGRLRLESVGTVTVEGRTGWLFGVSLGPAVKSAVASDRLPPVLEAKGGVDQGTLSRRAFLEHAEPKSIWGELVIDEQQGVVLSAKLDGRMSVPAQQGTKPAELKLTVNAKLTELGREQKIATPKEFLPDQDKPKGIADALERFGVAQARDRETSEAAEPEDEATEDEP